MHSGTFPQDIGFYVIDVYLRCYLMCYTSVPGSMAPISIVRFQVLSGFVDPVWVAAVNISK